MSYLIICYGPLLTWNVLYNARIACYRGPKSGVITLGTLSIGKN